MNVPADVSCALVTAAINYTRREYYGITQPCNPSLMGAYSDYMLILSPCVTIDKKTTLINKY